ncbi:MAG: universal stress protein [Thermodesulfovibrionales bacterium]
MYKKILYPIKFEEFSLDLLRCILDFKNIGTEEIVLVHVIDVSKLPMDKYEGYSIRDVESLKTIAEEKMKEAIRIVEEAGLRTKEIIRVGVPYREILKVVKEETGISLIVSGRQKKSPLKEIFIGSNTDRIIRYGDIPVFIPKYPAAFGASKEECEKICKNMFKRLLYPTDWSDCAKVTLEYLKGLKGAEVDEVVVAHVMNEKAMRLQPPEKFKEFEKEDMERLQTVKKELEQSGFKVKTRLEVGRPGTDLIRIAREEDITMIVMGTHGKGYVEGILWGSVSRNVVEYSNRPVLLIKSEKCLKEMKL